MRVYIYIYIYIHTHIHTQTQRETPKIHMYACMFDVRMNWNRPIRFSECRSSHTYTNTEFTYSSSTLYVQKYTHTHLFIHTYIHTCSVNKWINIYNICGTLFRPSRSPCENKTVLKFQLCAALSKIRVIWCRDFWFRKNVLLEDTNLRMWGARRSAQSTPGRPRVCL